MTRPTSPLPSADPAPGPDRGVPPRTPQRRFPEGFTLAAAAVFGAVMVLAGLLLWQLRQADGDLATAGSPTTGTAPTTATTSPAPTTVPSTTGVPSSTFPPGGIEPVACPAGLDPVICDAATYVQQVRQRPFQVFPTVEFLPDAEFDRALLADFEEYREELEAEGVTLSALGLLDPATSLADAYRDALEIGVVGFYDPETGRLVVRGEPGQLNLYVQQVLVHELVHALDDQWFDLDREDFVDGDAEYGFAAVVEGNARRVDERWRSELDPARQAQLAQDEMAALSADDLFRYFTLPPILQQLQLSPYVDGSAYVRHQLGVGGEAAVDDKLANPPLTSEAILHPGPAADEAPEVELAPPRAGGDVVDGGRLGEMLTTQWLGASAGEGWGGDRYVSWRDGNRSCIAIDLAADTPDDLAEMEQAARTWAEADAGDRTVGVGSVDGAAVVQVTGCAG